MAERVSSFPQSNSLLAQQDETQLFLKEENVQKHRRVLVKTEAPFLSDLLLVFALGNFNCRDKHEFFFVQSFQNVLPLCGGTWSIEIHMPMAMKYSSQNQSSLFFPLDYDQVAGKGRTQKHREYPTVYSKNKKRTRTGKV